MSSKMVSKQKRNNKKSQGNRRHVEQYAGDAYSLAMSTAKGLQYIRKLINIETKILDTSNGASITNAGTVSTVSTVAQGTDYNTRIGDSIKIQRMEFAFRWQIGASATKTFVRTLILRDLDGYGTLPAVTDVLQSADVLAPKTYLNADRFSILYDEVEALSSVNLTCTVGHYSTPHQGHIKYLGTTAASASNGKGSVYMLFMSSEPTNTPRVDFYSRIYFTDD